MKILHMASGLANEAPDFFSCHFPCHFPCHIPEYNGEVFKELIQDKIDKDGVYRPP